MVNKKKPKLNQPCPCGSGIKFKKCCFSINNKTQQQQEQEQEQEQCTPCLPEDDNYDSSSCHSYRFRVGDRVEASIRGGYRPGKIVAINYKEPGWLGTVPYQILLDGRNSNLVYAPFDEDDWVRELPVLAITKRRRQ